MAFKVELRGSVTPRSMFLIEISDTPEASASSTCVQPGRPLAARICPPVIIGRLWAAPRGNIPYLYELTGAPMSALSRPPSRMGENAVCRAGGAYTPQRSKPPLSSKSRSGWPQPLERGSRAGGRRVNSLPAFARWLWLLSLQPRPWPLAVGAFDFLTIAVG